MKEYTYGKYPYAEHICKAEVWNKEKTCWDTVPELVKLRLGADKGKITFPVVMTRNDLPPMTFIVAK